MIAELPAGALFMYGSYSARGSETVNTGGLWEGNQPEGDAPSLIDEFCRQTLLRTDSTALVDEHSRYSYGELFSRAFAVSRWLASRTVPINRTKCALILSDKTVNTAAAVLGCIMAGWVYACVDEEHPPSIIMKMVGSVAPTALLRASEVAWGDDFWRELEADYVSIADISDLITNGEGCSPSIDIRQMVDIAMKATGRGDDLAFFQFTSGTTGVSKCVCIAHASYADVIKRHINDFGISFGESIACQASFAFDPALIDLIAALSLGGIAVLVPTKLYFDSLAWVGFLQRYRVNTLMLVPAALEYGLAGLRNSVPLLALKRIILTGDMVSPVLMRLMGSRLPEHVRIFNAFGLTEAPYILTGEIDPQRMETANTFAFPTSTSFRSDFRMDETVERQPDGRDSYLLFVGPQVLCAGCYERGRVEPLVVDDLGLHCTGEVFTIGGGALPLQYMGRIDNRIKWRGYRIEPGEIEHAVCRHPAVVQARAFKENDTLVCEVWHSQVEDIDTGELLNLVHCHANRVYSLNFVQVFATGELLRRHGKLQ